MATVLVDLDGTLIPLDAWEPVFLEVCERIARQVGATVEEVWERARRRNLELMRAFAVEAFDWQSLFQSVAEELGAREAPDVVEVLYKHVHTFKVNRGAFEALRSLREAGHRVEIATNGLAVYQMVVIKHLGLDGLIDGVRTSDRFGCPKTCPQYFQGADVMVGDNAVFDVYFPRRFGLLTIFYGDWDRSARVYGERLDIDLTSTRPDAEIDSLEELPEAVEAVLKRRFSKG